MMDLETYISRYRGETRLQRLLHIGKTASDSALVTQAYELAEMQMKEDGNVLRYKEVFGDGTFCSKLLRFYSWQQRKMRLETRQDLASIL